MKFDETLIWFVTNSGAIIPLPLAIDNPSQLFHEIPESLNNPQ